MYGGGLADVNNVRPTFHPPTPHNLHAFIPTTTYLTFGLLELDDRVERLYVAVSKRRKMHRGRVASAQRVRRACADVTWTEVRVAGGGRPV